MIPAEAFDDEVSASLVPLGCFIAQSDCLVCGDPAYVDAGVNLSPVQPGMWHAYAVKCDFGLFDSNNRISDLIVCHAGAVPLCDLSIGKIDALPWETTELVCGVDSGMAGFYCRETIPGGVGREWFEDWYGRVCSITDGSDLSGITGDVHGPVGAVSSAGWGDGAYGIAVMLSPDTKEAVALRLSFIDRSNGVKDVSCVPESPPSVTYSPMPKAGTPMHHPKDGNSMDESDLGVPASGA
mmetsp:Transcript_22212/g.54646  ORF Transcript_22212/g.54646 Transcript_22212/m.54646 type:complete len:239 (+) Transcript_22212:97-813(+)